ncbi:MAG: hypothetical protein Q9218_007354 [Villophora microphyllina]
MTGAKPFSWAPSEWWDEIDGDWSSFDLRVGTPEQTVRVLPSTAGSATWIVTIGGCEPPTSNCSTARGGLFNQNQSSTWDDLGPYTLDLEQNLNHNESAEYGLDTICLGLSNATGGPALGSQIVAGIETGHWYTGVFGLQQQPMNLSDFSHPQQSFLSSLHARNVIPSLSWAYTAGAKYRSKGIFGSLTLGGSDISKYIPTNVSFNLAPDVGRDLVVGIQSLTSTYTNGSVSSLLTSPTLAFIDSTVPYLYLPEEVCNNFESELGLIYNEKINLYFVDDVLHQSLAALNPQFTFRLGNDKLSKPTVDITLPYASFDLTAKPPLVKNATSYFPLRRGTDDQITLGRAFLQEAYVITDYDQKNFTVAQALFNDNAKSNIVPIPWNATAAPNASRLLNRQARIGIGTGSAALVLLMAISAIFLVWRRRNIRVMTPLTDAPTPLVSSPELRPCSFISTQEMGHQSIPELHDIAHQLELLDAQFPSGSGIDINELPGGEVTSHQELLAPASRDRSAPSRDRRRAAHESTGHDVNEQSRSDRVQLSELSNQREDSSSYHSTRRRSDSLDHQEATGDATRHLLRAPRKANVNRTLPTVPTASHRREPNYSPGQGLPALGNHRTLLFSDRGERDHFARRDGIVIVSPQISRSSTYATIFDLEEYTDKAMGRRRHQRRRGNSTP